MRLFVLGHLGEYISNLRWAENDLDLFGNLKCSFVQNTQMGKHKTFETFCTGSGVGLVGPFEYILILFFLLAVIMFNKDLYKPKVLFNSCTV